MFSKRSVLSSKNVKKEFVGKIMFNKHRNFKTYFPSVSLMKELWQVVQLEIVFWFQNTPYKLSFCSCVSPVVRLSAHITMGQNQVILRHQKFTFPQAREWAKWAVRANEWAQRRARAKRAVRSKWTSEQCERTSERTSEWPSTQWVYSWIIRPTVQSIKG